MSKLIEVENTSIRDAFAAEDVGIADKLWKSHYGSTAPSDADKFFVTFPYPYMNGRLHLGHAYTIMKVEVVANTKRLKGFNVMFPFGFHGTGTPIVACADKVTNELKTFTGDEELSPKSQLGILEMMGVPREEFPNFVNPKYWIEYFPKIAVDDLKKFGISADLERSFVTTDMNPHYDSFVRWQFKRLNDAGILEYGKRYMIYSPDTKQPCSDHDRSVGEEVEPQQYTLIKMKLIEDKSDVYLLAGTLRPETMYGQTNVWINKEGTYSLFTIHGTKYIARYETYLNLFYQTEDADEHVILVEKEYIKGEALIGKSVMSPYVDHPIPILPMGKVSMKRGTGIVTSVPTDSPTDYLYWKEHCEGKVPELTGIIKVGTSKTFAADAVEEHKVSIGDNTKLDEIHESVYMKEHEEGVLLVGKYAGEALKTAHDKIQADMVSDGTGMIYYEPQKTVISRTGVECVVALTDQWYINYGIKEHTDRVNDHIEYTLDMYDTVAKELIKKASDWIDKWPVSRLATHCLGTLLPVDERFMIDSLSDSTAYFAYYTICNTVTKIPVKIMTPEAWDYIFSKNAPEPEGFEEYSELFVSMKKEFRYWYPLDFRVSGRDLIGNHLTMALYNHSFLWPDENMMPREYYTNGYAMLNGKKMSKSTGNFMTLSDAIDKYGADAVRVALAQAGDGMTDANFDENVARDAIVFLANEFNWVTSTMKEFTESKIDDSGPVTFWDDVFINEVNSIVNNFVVNINRVNIRKAFVCLYDMINARYAYIDINKNEHIFSSTDRDVYKTNLMVFTNRFITMMSVFCPFWIERVKSVIDIESIVGEITWPKMQDIDAKGIWIRDSVHDLVKQIRNKHSRLYRKNKKEYALTITSYTMYDEELVSTIKVLKDYRGGILSDDTIKEFFRSVMGNTTNKKLKAKLGKFSKTCSNSIKAYGVKWLDWVSDYGTDEAEAIEQYVQKIIKEVTFASVDVMIEPSTDSMKNGPGFPAFTLK